MVRDIVRFSTHFKKGSLVHRSTRRKVQAQILTQAMSTDPKAASFMSIVDSVSKLATSRRHPDQAVETGDGTHRKQKRVKTVWDMLVSQDRFISGIMDIQIEKPTCQRKTRCEGNASQRIVEG